MSNSGAPDVPRALVYLRNRDVASATLGALALHRARVICAWPEAKQADIDAASLSGQCVVAGPVQLGALLAEADWVINYGSSTLACQALLAGKPQLMLPSDTEKYVVARKVEAERAGVVVIPSRLSVAGLREGVADGLGRLGNLAQAAMAIAAQYSGFDGYEQLEKAVRLLLSEGYSGLPLHDGLLRWRDGAGPANLQLHSAEKN